MDAFAGFREGLLALSRAVAVAGSGLIAGLILTLAALFALQAALGEIGVTALIVVSLVLTQGVAFGGVALGYLVLRGLPRSFVPVHVPSLRDLAWIVGGYVLAFLAVMAGAAVVTLTGAPAASNRVGELGVENPELLLLLIPLSFLLVGPGEELLFRGIVQGSLRDVFGSNGAVVLASVIFASVHYVALSGGLGGRIVTIAILFLPSLVFGFAYERTRNLAVPALIHGAYNATLFVLLYVAVQMGDFAPA